MPDLAPEVTGTGSKPPPPMDNFEGGTETPATSAAAPAQNLYSPDEQKSLGFLSSLENTFKQVNSGQPAPAGHAPTLSELAERDWSKIPEPPAPTPGAYNPEQEQTALRAVNDIADPELRRVSIDRVKQNFANLRLMDGITAQVRDQAKNKSIAKWSNIVEQIVSGEGDWQTKQAVMAKILPAMRIDPTLDVGETKNLLEEHLLKQAGMPDVRELGSAYLKAQDAVVNGQITSNDQILRMEVDGQLTHKGAEWAMQSLANMSKPKGRVDAERTEFFKGIAKTIDPSSDPSGQGLGRTALGDMRMYLAEKAARDREAEILAAKGNPADVYNPNSKEYFGTPENLAKYVVSLQAAAQYTAENAKGKVPAASTSSPTAAAPAPQLNERKQFKQGWGVWNGSAWVPAQ